MSQTYTARGRDIIVASTGKVIATAINAHRAAYIVRALNFSATTGLAAVDERDPATDKFDL